MRLDFSATNNEAEYEALLIGMAMVQSSKFDSFDLLHIPRNVNAHVDSLAMLATSSTNDLPRVILVKDLYKPTKTRRETSQVYKIRAGPSWMDYIMQFLKEDTLSKERVEADKVQRKATRYWLFEN